ncbi:MAG: cell division protein FtsW [Actinomycetota bacterium]|jgi:cell division protein FtsW|nr:cell division protein FtsW [Actinomycetota bacterium]
MTAVVPGVATTPSAGRPPSAKSPARGQAPGSGADAVPLLHRDATPYYLLLGATLLLLVLGLVMVFSASSVTAFSFLGSSFAIVGKQLMWVVMGLPLMWLASRLPVKAWRAFAYLGLITSLALLFLVVFAGTEVNGNKNWLDFGGPFRIQPSELAKLSLVLWGADLLARKHRLLNQWKHLLVPVVPVGGFVIGLVLLGGDLGTAIILAVILAALLYVAGAPLRLFFWASVPAFAVIALMLQTRAARLSRITDWLHPNASDPLGSGFQALHGKFALASGGWWGVGLGGSKEKWGSLPEAHTDFIFAIIGEELGLVGTLAVLGLIGIIGYAGLRVAVAATDPFVRLAAAGVTAWILVQALINLGAVLGLLPITGVPLPLVSYGGSALVPTMLGLGMLLSFARPRGGGLRRPRSRAASG